MAAVTGCRQAVERLWDYLDQQLSSADAAEVDAHLAFCRRCCGELAFARELRGVLATRATPPVPDDVARRLTAMAGALPDLAAATDDPPPAVRDTSAAGDASTTGGPATAPGPATDPGSTADPWPAAEPPGGTPRTSNGRTKGEARE